MSKKTLILIIGLICTGCFNDSLSSNHKIAVDKFKQTAAIEKNDYGYNLYTFSLTYVATSQTYGECFFIYSEMKDIFRLGCLFDSYESSTSMTEGFVYVDFKWGDYTNQINYFDLITYSSSNEFCHCKYEFSNISINGDNLTGNYKCNITYSSYTDTPEKQPKTKENAFKMINQAFEYGKTIKERYSLPNFY